MRGQLGYLPPIDPPPVAKLLPKTGTLWPFFEAISGSWDWKDVLNAIHPGGTEEQFLELFDEIDDDGDGTLDMYELEKGLTGKVTAEELKALLQAADSDGDGVISKEEWAAIVAELFVIED